MSSKGWLRFGDLKARNVVKSWAQLKRLVENYGFPPGRMLSPNVRAWTDDEIDEWLETRPIEGPPPRGVARTRRGNPGPRPRAA